MASDESERVVLVDYNDVAIGVYPKLEAHAHGGKLHRAFSIYIFNGRGELLMQRRAATKYHAPLLWANTCCGHPRPDEGLLIAAARRLEEEMGIVCGLVEAFAFTYMTPVGMLTEWEYGHVIFGFSEADPVINRDEASEARRMPLRAIAADMARSPGSYAPWFRLALPYVIEARGGRIKK